MRKIALLSTALTFAFVSSAWAGASDKSSNTLVDVNATGVIDNNLVKTKVKSKGCSLQIQAKPIALADGAVVICLGEADVISPPSINPPGAGNSIVLAGEVKAGALKIKVDLTEATFGPLGCGSVNALQFNNSLRCFTDDATYRGDANVPGSWRDACLAAGMVDSPTAPGTTMLKVNDTQPIVVGLCQAIVAPFGKRIDPPASLEWGRTGGRVAVIVP